VTSDRDPDLADRVLKLERTVRSIGEILAAGLAIGPAYIAGHVVDRFGFSDWVVSLVGLVVWLVTGAVFWKWYGRDLRP
jgi:hypothetical protein